MTRSLGTASLLGFGMALALCAVLLTGGARSQQSATYTNPVSRDFADTFPDPAIIKAKDGYWYAYGTSDPTRQSFGDNSFHDLPVARSKDMVDWEYVGDVFTGGSRPAWHPDGQSFLWAPDVRYLDGKYYLYYSLVKFGPDGFATIGVATAPTPTGPWTDSGGPVIEQGACDTNNIDPAEFTDKDGTRYLYWGSYGDICVAKMNAEGTRVVGEAERISYGGQAEAAYIVRQEDYYYLFISEGGCCSGAFSSYEVFVGRSKSPMGPFVDREGVPMDASRRGGTLVLAANGNKWVGPGHHSQTTDLAGQDWMVYHAIDKNDPYLELPYEGINRRPLMIDRLDWIDGWPTVRAGAWASEDPQPAPVSTPAAGDDFNGRTEIGADWRREGAAQDGWHLANEDDAGGYVRQNAPASKPSYLVSAEQAPADVRAEADLRLPQDSEGAAGLVAAYRDPENHVVTWLDAGEKALVTEAVVNRDGRRGTMTRKTTLSPGFRFDEWHNVAVEIRGSQMSVEVTDARMGAPLATQTLSLPEGANAPGSVGAASRSARSEADNISAAPLYTPATGKVPDPAVGTLLPENSDEFNDRKLDRNWSFVRTPDGEETGSSYVWPTQAADLFRDNNTASVLLRDAPDGDYTVETKLTIDLGTETIRNFQQAGLVAYANDNLYNKLVHVAIDQGRRTEFAKEDGNYGSMPIGPPAETTWLRIQHKVDSASGERELRAATSRDGENWVYGAVWSMPLESEPRIGLVSMGGKGATAKFDYFRVYDE